MLENNPYGFARKTPKFIKAFIAVILFFNFLVTLQSTYLPQASFYSIFALSLKNISQGFIWPILTYSFLIPSTVLSFGFLLNLAFYLYTFWIFSLSLVERIGKVKFSLLYLSSSILTALASLLVMSLTNSKEVFGNMSPVAYSYLVCWVFLNPLSEIRLFFALPFKAKNLLFALLGINLFFELSRLDLLLFFSNLTGAFVGYLFALFINKTSFSWWKKFQKKPSSTKKEKTTFHDSHSSKVYDFTTGRPLLNDEEFMDAMLQRVSLYGETILTKEEKTRMETISQKKKSKS